jgi:hypothetical protein
MPKILAWSPEAIFCPSDPILLPPNRYIHLHQERVMTDSKDKCFDERFNELSGAFYANEPDSLSQRAPQRHEADVAHGRLKEAFGANEGRLKEASDIFTSEQEAQQDQVTRGVGMFRKEGQALSHHHNRMQNSMTEGRARIEDQVRLPVNLRRKEDG